MGARGGDIDVSLGFAIGPTATGGEIWHRVGFEVRDGPTLRRVRADEDGVFGKQTEVGVAVALTGGVVQFDQYALSRFDVEVGPHG